MSESEPDLAMHIVTVCSHNRTRSVMTAALLQRMLDERFGPGAALVEALGFGPEGLPSIPDAVDAMRRRGLDTNHHRSRQVTKDNIEPADLVLTSEREHVIKIAAISPTAFRQSMTLPEFLTLSEWQDTGTDAGTGTGTDGSLRAWVASLTVSRTARDYITGDVEEIDDPTGTSPRAFESAVIAMEEQCRRAVDVIARIVPPPTG